MGAVSFIQMIMILNNLLSWCPVGLQTRETLPLRPTTAGQPSRPVTSQTKLYNEREIWAPLPPVLQDSGGASVWNCSIYGQATVSSASDCLPARSHLSSFTSKSRTDIIRTRPESESSHIISRVTWHSLWQAPSGQRNKKVWNLLEFPITWNWFLCDHKGFYLAGQARPVLYNWSWTQHFTLLLVLIFLQSPG